MAYRFAVLLISVASCSHAAVLYDATTGTTPNEQGWTSLSNPIFGEAHHTIREGTLVLDSLSVLSDQAGYFSKVPALSLEHPQSPVVDLKQQVFAIDFSIRLVAAVDAPDTDARYVGQRNRGGFAVIAIGEDLTGVELQFQSDHIVALDNADSAFSIGELVSLNTGALREYRLILEKSGYRLFTDGTLLLTGPVRDYSAFAPSPPFDFPYTTPSFFFFGDDTARAGARTEIERFAVAELGDCSHDGLMDRSDLSCVSLLEERDAILRVLNSSPGDLDGDGRVAFADFLTLSRNFGQTHASYAEGNVDLLNGVDFGDFLMLSSNFGATVSEVAIVPEPKRCLVWLVGATCLVLRTKKRPALRRGVS